MGAMHTLSWRLSLDDMPAATFLLGLYRLCECWEGVQMHVAGIWATLGNVNEQQHISILNMRSRAWLDDRIVDSKQRRVGSNNSDITDWQQTHHKLPRIAH